MTSQPRPRQLAPSAAVIQVPQRLPDPTGAAAGMQAIAAGNLFRDMSGLEATSSLLQKGLELAAENDWRSADQATKAMEEANRHMEKMSQLAVDAAKDVAPLVLGPAGGVAANASKLGALLNFASATQDGAVTDQTSGGAAGRRRRCGSHADRTTVRVSIEVDEQHRESPVGFTQGSSCCRQSSSTVVWLRPARLERYSA